jgi:hypothetical protein
VKIRDDGLVRNKAVYVALAHNPDGDKEVLGLWIEQSEGAKFWLKVRNELKSRGVNDILVAIVPQHRILKWRAFSLADQIASRLGYPALASRCAGIKIRLRPPVVCLTNLRRSNGSAHPVEHRAPSSGDADDAKAKHHH